ncbi:hypothetical protein C9374_009813 [Naegleria lovaniensis]|uniref:Ras family small GTPase n=1 Tax=Naegleria lovaniensis TaxID=51637 RepID=A0AA88H5Q4_NAELO|nr:uncharacterized protein C9374_009813 [Naegleria lovaniensis]KAG2393236.1 hypothetical protein C9374_009813 [Naegleria lovaniensis]
MSQPVSDEFTLAVCGGVGKSSLTVQWTQNHFMKYYDPTIESTFSVHKIIDNKETHLTIIDTAGQDEYKTLRDVYMRSAFGFVLVFDCTLKSSLEELKEFTKQLERLKKEEVHDEEEHEKKWKGNLYPCVVVANKFDLIPEDYENRELTEKEIKEFMKTELLLSENTPLIFTSAKTAWNVVECFETIVREMRAFSKVELPPQEVTSSHQANSSTSRKRNSLFLTKMASVSDSHDCQNDLKMFLM